VKIVEVRTRLVGYRKLDPPMQRSFALVRVETDDGTVGWGEASTNWGHSYPTVLRATVDDVCAGHLVGRDPLAIRDRMAELAVVLDGYLGTEGTTSQALGAIEIALWDIAGKHHGVPVHRLLGAAASPIPLYGTGTTMFEESADWHARYFDRCMALGFAGVKVRLGRDLADDVEVVRTVREHLGPRPLIGVDSYWFHDPDTAIALAHEIAPLRIHFFEEPVPQHRLVGLERVQHASPIRIAVGERVYSPDAYAELARRDAARVFEPDATLAGGILNCLRIADIAERHSIEVIPHVGGPTVVGLAANLHWATAARVRLCEYDIDAHQPMITDIGVNPGLALDDLQGGTIMAPSGPGLGVDVDEDLLDAFPYVPGDTYVDVFPEHESGRSSTTRTIGPDADEAT
jgi:L-alanine-DL-glutamate epimerase-like enolase superfamily enzyme